ncbi:hypothetical protein ACVIM8_001893 [Bradyrhizobium sp. USDA 4529]
MKAVRDPFATAHKLRMGAMIDIFSRLSPALRPRSTFRGADVVGVLERTCKETGDDPRRPRQGACVARRP